VNWGHVNEPPRTLAYCCAHELTHIVTGEHIGMVGLLRLPQWVREGIADYVAIENRQSFEQLSDALGDRPVDVRRPTVPIRGTACSSPTSSTRRDGLLSNSLKRA
jgi:hypothetical protein